MPFMSHTFPRIRFLINVNRIKLYELRIQIFSKSNKNQHVKALANNGV